MKSIELKQKINIVHVQKKSMVDDETKKEVIYFEYVIEVPVLLGEAAEKATSGTEFKTGEHVVVLSIGAKAKDVLKIRILKPQAPSQKEKPN